jgi:hypothetical protein
MGTFFVFVLHLEHPDHVKKLTVVRKVIDEGLQDFVTSLETNPDGIFLDHSIRFLLETTRFAGDGIPLETCHRLGTRGDQLAEKVIDCLQLVVQLGDQLSRRHHFGVGVKPEMKAVFGDDLKPVFLGEKLESPPPVS